LEPGGLFVHLTVAVSSGLPSAMLYSSCKTDDLAAEPSSWHDTSTSNCHPLRGRSGTAPNANAGDGGRFGARERGARASAMGVFLQPRGAPSHPDKMLRVRAARRAHGEVRAARPDNVSLAPAAGPPNADSALGQTARRTRTRSARPV